MSEHELSDDQIRATMSELVRKVDVDLITTKQFIAQLSSRMGGIDLKPRKKYIKTTLTEIIDEMQQQQAADEDLPPEPEAEPKKKRGGGGLSAEREISAELRDFLGAKKTKVARTEIVKALWVHIRENNLQNPEDRREIILDDKMKRVFGVDRFSMFHMAKYVGAHVDPFKPVDLTPKPKDPNKVKKKRKSKGDDGKDTKKKKRKREGGEKRKPPASFTAPYRLSQELIDVVGEDCLSRPQVTSKLWEYIKARDMQFPQDKRTIICDDKFKLIMDGNDRVTMFQMNKFVSPHLLQRLDVDAPPVEEEKTLNLKAAVKKEAEKKTVKVKKEAVPVKKEAEKKPAKVKKETVVKKEAGKKPVKVKKEAVRVKKEAVEEDDDAETEDDNDED
jgi:upstream activation factor subunit UAF30